MNSSPAPIAHLRHELRTPLGAVLGYSEMMLEDLADAGPAELSADLEKIRTGGAELLSLVNGALVSEGGPGDESAPETVAADLSARLTGPAAALRDSCTLALTKASSLGADAMMPDLHQVEAAASRFASLLESLRDGISIASIDDLTEPKATVSAAAPSSAPEGDDDVTRTSHPILIVDDSEVNRALLSRQLAREGHPTAVAESGDRALEMLRTGDFDLVLVDILMPGMRGDEVLRRLKADPRLRDVPVIMISALDATDMVGRCIELGAEDYLPKPADPVLLRARIGASLEKKRLRDAEVAYLHDVDRLVAAAAAVEVGEFEPAQLQHVADRSDELGRLARVFGRMAEEVRAREQRLQSEVRQLRVEIDQAKTARYVAEITETDYFKDLLQKVDTLRLRADPAAE